MRQLRWRDDFLCWLFAEVLSVLFIWIQFGLWQYMVYFYLTFFIHILFIVARKLKSVFWSFPYHLKIFIGRSVENSFFYWAYLSLKFQTFHFDEQVMKRYVWQCGKFDKIRFWFDGENKILSYFFSISALCLWKTASKSKTKQS